MEGRETETEMGYWSTVVNRRMKSKDSKNKRKKIEKEIGCVMKR